jgi:hypothetical protein
MIDFFPTVLTDKGSNTTVENIRNLAEYVVFSEKYQSNYFEILCEEDTFSHFLRFLQFNNPQITI